MASFPSLNLSFRLSTGESLDVRTFRIEERMSTPFKVDLVTRSPDPDLDLEGFVGEPARFEIAQGRSWVGAVRVFELEQAEPTGLSTYRVELVHAMWLLTQRRNHRIFQRMSEPDIVKQILDEWKISYEARIASETYKKRDYRVQYGESDFAFISRMLEDAGITYWFETAGDLSKLILSDSAEAGEPRAPIESVDDPSAIPWQDYVTKLSVAREVRPGKYTMRDVDYRIPPNYPLLSSSADGKPLESQLESFHYVPGAFLFEGEGSGTPSADSKLTVRTSEREAERLAKRRLEAKRAEARTYKFVTNALDVRPGLRVPIVGHVRGELGADQPLLVTSTVLSGTSEGGWEVAVRATRSDAPFRPALVTPKPKVSGVETATVVGASGDEIHTDEFGRIRVHFHWDRQSRMNDDSSCWVPVSQPWAGTGFGGVNIPRVGQEVIVDFLGGDPDRPIVVGRVYTASQPVPFKLPENKTQSGWKSSSTTGSGGYNEIMFEDSVGKEVFRQQAERDMQTLVKHDETRTIQRDRTTKILRDEKIDIGRDRTETVKQDETITVGRNRTETVIGNETLTVQGNRTRAVHGNEDIFIGASYSEQVVENFTQTIGGNSTSNISGNRSAAIGASDSTTVALNRSANIGVSDSVTVGLSHSISVAPGGAPLGSHHMTPGKTEIQTGLGATLTLEGTKITLKADTIVLDAKNIYGIASEKIAMGGAQGVSMGSASGEAKVNGKTLKLSGASSADLTSSGPTTVSGTPVQLNGPGLFAGRVTELAPATITTGAALVLVGGASFPFEVTKDAAGNLHVGPHIIVQPDPNDPNFQNKVMRDLGIMSSTPNGLGRLNNIQNNPGGHNLTIRPYSAAEAAQYGQNNSLTYAHAGASLGYDAAGNPVPGPGSDTEISYNPDIVLGPNGSPEPGDATLFHEMGHAEHNVYGINRQGEALGGGWDNQEEYQTIQGGVNQPGGSQIPGVPTDGSENQYLGERGYPYRRTNHGSGYSNPDGSPIGP